MPNSFAGSFCKGRGSRSRWSSPLRRARSARPSAGAGVGRPGFLASVPVIHILAAAVIFRVGNATATTLLKGAGNHRLLAFANVSIALANLALSVALVRTHGIVGVALGTLIPLASSRSSSSSRRPAAARAERVERRVGGGVAVCVARVFDGGLPVCDRSRFGGSGRRIDSAQPSSAGPLYAMIFLWLAIGREERLWYFSKITAVVAASASGGGRVRFRSEIEWR